MYNLIYSHFKEKVYSSFYIGVCEILFNFRDILPQKRLPNKLENEF